MDGAGAFTFSGGIFSPPRAPCHRSAEYDERTFALLLRMQREHFWYRGRHCRLFRVLDRELGRRPAPPGGWRALDLGGGCGGWLEYLHARRGGRFGQLALGDSSRQALELAGGVVGPFAGRYHVDLLDLPWTEAWDVVFLLDVLEHIPDHAEVLRQVRRSLRPGGLLFVTAPALPQFWTYNDDWARHQRRYARRDFQALAGPAGFELLRSEYFMFCLSLPLFLSRCLFRPPAAATPEEIEAHAWQAHRIPARPLNELLAGVLAFEAAAADVLRLPWGTSILAVLRR